VKEIAGDLARWHARGERVALATVVSARRSAPRPVGSVLGVSESGELAGSVSGGCVESEVFEQAREVLAGGAPRLLQYGISDDLAFSAGLPCGGEIEVFVAEEDAAVSARLLEAIERGERGRHVVALRGERLGEQALLLDDGLTIGNPAVASLAAEELYVRRLGPPPRLVVIGAVDTAEALCATAKLVGWRTAVVDARAKFATRERLPSADEIVLAWPEEAFGKLGLDRDDAVVVLTHDEKFDEPALRGAVASEAFYVGALGSRRTQAKRLAKLREAGVAGTALERIAGPCGLDVGAASPAETALSIVAEVMAVRSGRGGGSLRETKGSISPDRSPVPASPEP
jgi:xanthine dehydrogenase accessory factor